MNYFMGLYEEIPEYLVGGKKYTRRSMIESPAGRWLFIDEHEDSILSGQFSFANIEWRKFGWIDIPATRHAGSGVMSFADGHAETRRWVDPRTRVPVLRKKQFGAVAGSGGNRDVLWLWQRTTTPLPPYLP